MTETPTDPVSNVPFELPSRDAIVLVVDLVESVRLMEIDERGVIQRWQAFSTHVHQTLLPAHGGRLVKNLGDGLMAEFTQAHEAVRAASAMHAWMADFSQPLEQGHKLGLRAGVHVARIYDGKTDIYGVGVNLAARVATLAEAGETVASSQLRDLLSDMLDADIEDLGECRLKHVDRPVRAYRLGPAQHVNSMPLERSYATKLQASLAVIPFEDMLASVQFQGVGDLLADGIIGALSGSRDLHAVSRLSSSNFRTRGFALSEIATRLDVRYVVSGSYAIAGQDLTVTVELADTAGGHILWSGRLCGKWQDLLLAEGGLIYELADGIHRKLLETTASRASTRPLPALDSYEMFLGGVSMMHRASADDFNLSRRLLESLTERHRRVAAPHAWLAKWYVLRTIQGGTNDLAKSADEALSHTKRALDLEPGSALALAIEGFVYCHLKKDLETAESRLQQACAVNPSEGFAWLFLAVMHAFRGDAPLALEEGRRALALSPIDPLRYYYESLMGSCEFSAGNHAEAIRWCEASRRRNRQHLSTLRILIAAYEESGQREQAAKCAADLRQLRSNYTVEAYEASSVAVLYPFGQRIARALRAAGVP